MYYHHSTLSKEQYLTAMKRKFTNPFFLFGGRLTGIVLGNFFAAAHYQEYEWNHRITNECNRAWGYVQEVDGQLKICVVRGKGLLAPGWMLGLTLLCRALFFSFELRNEIWLSIELWILSAVFALVVGLATAIGASVTEAGQAGALEIDKFLMDPENYYY